MEYNLSNDFTEFGNHLRKRGLKPWHRVWIDPVAELVTFPLWSIESWAGTSQNRRLVGYQRYNWREDKLRDNGGKYFTWVSDLYKDRIAYGIENCRGHGPLFIVEGVWDSLRVVNSYFDCLALLTCSPSKNLKAHLRQLAGRRPIVGLIDNDDNHAGDSMKSACDLWFYPPDGYKDMNAVPEDVVFSYLTNVRNMVKLNYGNNY